MQHTPVKEVWGIGYQLVKQLGSYEIYSCLDLTFANEHHLAKAFSVVMARTIRELKANPVFNSTILQLSPNEF